MRAVNPACGSGSAPQLAGTDGPDPFLDDGSVLAAIRASEPHEPVVRFQQPEVGDRVEPLGGSHRQLSSLHARRE